MPITLTKLFSPTAAFSFPYLGETVNITWAPFRWTGEMQELAERTSDESEANRAEITKLREKADGLEAEAEALKDDPDAAAPILAEASALRDEIMGAEVKLDTRDKARMREMLLVLLVGWDVLGEDGKPIEISGDQLKKLPTPFLLTMFLSFGKESAEDPPNAPLSGDASNTERPSARSRTGSSSSTRPVRSGSRRSSSTNGRTGPASTRSGGGGR